MKELKREEGELMVEAVIVFSITIMVVFILMNFALFTYQKGNLTALANRAASDIANSYAYENAEPVYGYISENAMVSRKLYRYLGLTGSTSLDKAQCKKAKWYAAATVQSTELVSAEEGNNFDKISAKVKKTSIGTRQIQVTIERTYSVLAINPFKYFGYDTKYTYTATGCAQCYDMIDYINNEGFKAELKDRVLSDTSLEETAGKANTMIDKIKALQERIKKCLDGESDS